MFGGHDSWRKAVKLLFSKIGATVNQLSSYVMVLLRVQEPCFSQFSISAPIDYHHGERMPMGINTMIQQASASVC